LCKVLQRNAARLHSSAQGAHEGESAESPGFIDRKFGKRPDGDVFENAVDLFGREIAYAREEAESPASQAQRGLAPDFCISQFDQVKRAKAGSGCGWKKA
jgi:hypothetical protein